MKKILITGLFILLALPVFASNTLQQQAEKEFFNNPEIFLRYKASASIFLIWQDYQTFKDSPETLTGYGYLLSLKDKYCKFTDTKSKINCKYINQLTTNMSKIGNYNLMDGQAELYIKILKEYQSSKIIIDDNDYQYLDPKILNIIIRTF